MDKLRDFAEAISKGLGDKEFMQVVADNDMAGTVHNWIHTGNYALDYIISGRADGSGGVPVGRVTEFFGEPGSGKSMLGYHMIVDTQKQGGIAVMLDTEDAYYKDFGEVIGIDNNQLVYGAPTTVEEVADILDNIIENAETPDAPPILVFWDGIAKTSTKHEITENMEKRDMTKAQMIHKLFRRIGKEKQISETNIAVVATNFVTSQIGVLFGPDTVAPGGRGYKFASSLRLEINQSSLEKEDGKVIGHKSLVKVAKNRVWYPFGKIYIDIRFDSGIQPYSGLLDILEDEEIIRTAGGWKKYTEDNSFRKGDFADWVKDNPQAIIDLQNVEKYKKKEEEDGESELHEVVDS